MKFLDKVIRYWRVNIALENVPTFATSAFDIGCDDGYLLNRVSRTVTKRDGIDPRLEKEVFLTESELTRGYFPKDLSATQQSNRYDAIFALAVFEHFSENDLKLSAKTINRLLTEDGRLIVTVPHPAVDKLLDILMGLQLIDGQATEEHHGFNPTTLVDYFAQEMRLVDHKKFQFGLNNLFVFGRK